MPNTKSPRLIALDEKQFADKTYFGDDQTASHSTTRNDNGAEPLPAVLNAAVDAAKNGAGKCIGPAATRHAELCELQNCVIQFRIIFSIFWHQITTS